MSSIEDCALRWMSRSIVRTTLPPETAGVDVDWPPGMRTPSAERSYVSRPGCPARTWLYAFSRPPWPTWSLSTNPTRLPATVPAG